MPQTVTNPKKRRRIVWVLDFDKTVTLHHTGDGVGLFKYRHSKHYNNVDEIRRNIKFLEDFKTFVDQREQEGDIFVIASFSEETRFCGDYFDKSPCPLSELSSQEYNNYMNANPTVGITGNELISKYTVVAFGEKNPFTKAYLIQAFQPLDDERKTNGKRPHIKNAVVALKNEGVEFGQIIVVDDDGNNCRIAEIDGHGSYRVDANNTSYSFWPALALQPEISLFKRYAKIFKHSQKFESDQDELEFKELWHKYENMLENNAIKDPNQLHDIICSLMWCLSPLKDDPVYTKKYRDIMVRVAKYNDPQMNYEMAKFHAEGKYGFDGAEQACDYMKIAVVGGSTELKGKAIQYLRDNRNLFGLFNKKYPAVVTCLIESELAEFEEYTDNYYQRLEFDESKFRQLWEKFELAIEHDEITDPDQDIRAICALAKCYSRHKDDEQLQGKFVKFLDMAEPYEDPELYFDLATYHFEKKYGLIDSDKACEYIRFVLNQPDPYCTRAAEYLSNHREFYAIVVKKYPSLKMHQSLLFIRPPITNVLEYMQWIVPLCNNPEIFTDVQQIFSKDIEVLEAKAQKEFILKIINALNPLPEEFSINEVKDPHVNRCIDMMRTAERCYLSLNQAGVAEIFAKILAMGVTLNEYFIFSDFLKVTSGCLDEHSSVFLRYLKNHIELYMNLDNNDNPKLSELVRNNLFIQLYCNYPLNPADKHNMAIYKRLRVEIEEIYEELRSRYPRRSNDEEKLFQTLNEHMTLKRKTLEEDNTPSTEQSVTHQSVSGLR